MFTDSSHVYVLGHRGYSSVFPENTLLSFDACTESCFIDGIELDVHLTHDGKLAVCHDSNLKRTTGKDSCIEDINWEDVSLLDAGSFKDSAFRECRIPLLSDVFSSFGKRFIYDIELKVKPFKFDFSLCDAVYRTIKDFNLESSVMISSFNPLALGYFGHICQHRIPTADIFSYSKDVPFFLRRGFGHYISRSTYRKPQFDLIDNLPSGLGNTPIVTWTVNDSETAFRLLEKRSQGCPISGLIGNDPFLLASVVQKQKK